MPQLSARIVGRSSQGGSALRDDGSGRAAGTRHDAKGGQVALRGQAGEVVASVRAGCLYRVGSHRFSTGHTIPQVQVESYVVVGKSLDRK